jgi:tRNA(adenine34) deaminase
MKPFPYTIVPETDDERFMLAALKEAWKAYEKKEVPIGAVLVHDGRIISRGFNQVELLQDATAHAEMLAITAGAAAIGNWRLNETILYTTVEPCPMCAGAAILSRVKKIIYGAPDIRQGAHGSWVNLFECEHPIHNVEIIGGIYSEVAGAMMKSFFVERRREKGE